MSIGGEELVVSDIPQGAAIRLFVMPTIVLDFLHGSVVCIFGEETTRYQETEVFCFEIFRLKIIIFLKISPGKFITCSLSTPYQSMLSCVSHVLIYVKKR